MPIWSKSRRSTGIAQVKWPAEDPTNAVFLPSAIATPAAATVNSLTVFLWRFFLSLHPCAFLHRIKHFLFADDPRWEDSHDAEKAVINGNRFTHWLHSHKRKQRGELTWISPRPEFNHCTSFPPVVDSWYFSFQLLLHFFTLVLQIRNLGFICLFSFTL